MNLSISASRVVSTGLTAEENRLERKPFSTMVALTVARNNSIFLGASCSCRLCNFSASAPTGGDGSVLSNLEGEADGDLAIAVKGATKDAGAMTTAAGGTALPPSA